MLHFPCISQGNKGCDLYIPFAPFYLLINHCLLLVVLYGITRPLPSGNVSDKISFQQYSSLSVITPSTLLSTNKMVICSGQFSCSVMSDSLRPHGLQHTRPPCLSPTPGVYSNSCPLSWWWHATISSSLAPSPPTFNLSQHQGLFKWVSSSHQVAKVLKFQLQHQSFQWIFRTDFL